MIYLVPFGKVENKVLLFLKEKLRGVFEEDVEVLPKRELLFDSFNFFRNQYRAEAFLKELPSDDKNKYLGIVDRDLYVPELNFVFGLAEKGRAVIGIRRLRQEFYGFAPDEDLFLERVLKEAVHELGHVYGLKHCPNIGCVMHFSNSLIDTDRKGSSFCPECEKILKEIKDAKSSCDNRK